VYYGWFLCSTAYFISGGMLKHLIVKGALYSLYKVMAKHNVDGLLVSL